MPPWIQFVIGSVAAYYLISPLVIRRKLKTNVYAQYAELVAAALPANVAEYFEAHARFLVPGFALTVSELFV